MKHSTFFSIVRCTFRWIMCTAFTLFFSISGYGQIGNTMQNPIIVGPYSSSFQYSDSKNTANFTNNYSGHPTNDIFYRLELKNQVTIVASLCGSSISDTYLHLLNASGNRIAYNDDYTGDERCSNTFHSYMKITLPAGVYFFVVEGVNQNGVISIYIRSGQPSIDYTYDAAGNRIERRATSAIVLRSSAMKEEITEKEEADEITSLEKVEEVVSNTKITVFPNPTEGLITVEISDYIEQVQGEAQLFDFAGKALDHQKINSTSTNIDLSNYSNGMYLLKVHINGETFTQQIIKK